MGPELLAPQRFGLKDSRPAKTSDRYALGMVIYETISRNLPFHEYKDVEVIVKVLDNERPARGAKFTKSLWGMLERCWVPQPSRRPSIEDVLQCLETPSSFSESPLGTDEVIEVYDKRNSLVWGPQLGLRHDHDTNIFSFFTWPGSNHRRTLRIHPDGQLPPVVSSFASPAEGVVSGSPSSRTTASTRHPADGVFTNKRVTQEVQERKPVSSAKGPVSGTSNLPETDTPVIMCRNCQSTDTPIWKRDSEGHPLCNECRPSYVSFVRR